MKMVAILFAVLFFVTPVKSLSLQQEKVAVILGELHRKDILVTSLPNMSVGGSIGYIDSNGNSPPEKPYRLSEVKQVIQISNKSKAQSETFVHEAVHALTKGHQAMHVDKNGFLPFAAQTMAQVYEKRNPEKLSYYKNAKPGTPAAYGDYNRTVRPTEAIAMYGADSFAGRISPSQRIPLFDQVLRDSNLGVLVGQKKKTGLFK